MSKINSTSQSVPHILFQNVVSYPDNQSFIHSLRQSINLFLRQTEGEVLNDIKVSPKSNGAVNPGFETDPGEKKLKNSYSPQRETARL